MFSEIHLRALVSCTEGKKLGGAKSSNGMSPNQLAARAAELRAEVCIFHGTWGVILHVEGGGGVDSYWHVACCLATIALYLPLCLSGLFCLIG